MPPTSPRVVAVSRSASHSFSKDVLPAIRVVAGLGVEGDAHSGPTVKHRSRVRRDPSQANLRQVHLLHAELLEELAVAGFRVEAGQLGENVLTRGVDLLGIGRGTRLRLGESALVEITGLRNPCSQLDGFQPGLMAALLGRRPDGELIRKSGVMAIVLEGGEIRPGDAIGIESPPGEHFPLGPV